MPYHHKVSTHHRAKRAKKITKLAGFSVTVALLFGVWVGIDYMLTSLQNDTVVSVESGSTVQAAQINIFSTEYYRFQSDSSWREVTDELTFDNSGDIKQYLYRRFEGNFIEHELFITVNQSDNYRILKHNEPTRVLPVDLDAQGRLIAQDTVSETCYSLEDIEAPNRDSRDIEMKDVTFFCNPDKLNDYVVAVGQSGGSEKIPIETVAGEEAAVTITYRNITVNPDARQLERILSNFKFN